MGDSVWIERYSILYSYITSIFRVFILKHISYLEVGSPHHVTSYFCWGGGNRNLTVTKGGIEIKKLILHYSQSNNFKS